VSSAVLELLPAPGEWTEEDYYPLSERGRLVELSDGNIEVIESPTYFHQLILARLFLALHAFVSQGKLGKVIFAPLPIRLWPGKIREPDLMYMSASHADRIAKYWGIPDLAVEILSPGTEENDREVKRHEYAQAGMTEYWIIDPDAKNIEVLQLDTTSGQYSTGTVYSGEDQLRSALFPDFTLSLPDLFQEEN
jgi:Uma2 family endonuclease